MPHVLCTPVLLDGSHLETDVRRSPSPGVREPSEVSSGPQGPLLFAEVPLPETLAAVHTGSPSGTAPTTALT